MILRNELEARINAVKAGIARKNSRITDLVSAGVAQLAGHEPTASAGLFAAALPAWEAGRSYAQYEAFVYEGAVYFARQAVTAQEHQTPGSTGMESVYGVRPIPDAEGIYPYTYNMAAGVGMRVREGDTVYTCTQAIDPLLWPPSQVAAHFEVEV